jgi:NAD(P)-dependent dehydrogenase (short-subunit alcohol dehydrogenase family)
MPSEPERLKGRRVVITGAASGIGLATARLFIREGAKVGLIDRNEAALAPLREALGAPASGFVADVSSAEQVSRAVEAAGAAMGGIDGIVNAAGVSRSRPFEDVEPEDWRAILAVNLDGPYHVCRVALPFLREARRGTIVNIASGVALRPIPGCTAYAASKAGLIGFGKALAVDLAPHDIRVNTVCPGIVETPMIRARIANARDPEDEQRRLFERRLIRRFGQPEEIAHAILFLTADECSYVSGSVFAIDGGGTMH